MLVAAAYVARQLGHPLQAFARASSEIRQRAERLYAAGPDPRLMFLCAYLNRLEPAAPLPCDLSRSVLHGEYTEGGLFGVLAGDVDRKRAPSVAVALALVAADVSALSDFGREDLPEADAFTDRGYWAELCAHALRWGRATGDVALVARVVQLAHCLDVAADVPALGDAIAYLLEQQDADGAFGVTDALGADPVRPGVLAAIGALMSENRRE
jgi:hypothetical protein